MVLAFVQGCGLRQVMAFRLGRALLDNDIPAKERVSQGMWHYTRVKVRVHKLLPLPLGSAFIFIKIGRTEGPLIYGFILMSYI